ncbi:hypothetical protein EVAR_76962_1 [Eumeta japonica]|uniref:Uncharacterized protein n=1 Tax=Eumeta variegata TaxID=151549 RepID=A0A4C1SF63_EUMVA|nr:hypothetical protein EVAR_76962_1 [Eumeta japonica]
MITKLLHRYGDYVGFWLGSEFNVLVKNPADVRGYLTGEIPYSQVCKREEQLALLRVAFRPVSERCASPLLPPSAHSLSGTPFLRHTIFYF